MLHTPNRLQIDPAWFAVFAAKANGPVVGLELSVEARTVRPGDYLPSQDCLAETPWHDCGFRVGPLPRDVSFDRRDDGAKVLLFGPLGVLDSLTQQSVVLVVRPGAS